MKSTEDIKLKWQKHNRDNGLSWNEVAELVNEVANSGNETAPKGGIAYVKCRQNEAKFIAHSKYTHETNCEDKHGLIYLKPIPLPRVPDVPTLDEADVLVKSTNYAIEATHTDINPINWGDASAFYIEGFSKAIELITKPKK